MTPTQIQRAREQHTNWINSLTTSELAEVKRLGVDNFVDPLATSHSFEFAEEALANSTASGDLIDKVAEEFGRSRSEILEIVSLVGGEREESSTGLREILSILLSSSDSRLCAAALAVLSGIASQTGFASEAAVAESVGVSRQVLSKEVGRLSKILGDISLVFRRPEKARSAYSRAQKLKHWRRRPASQAFSSSPASAGGGDIATMIPQPDCRGGVRR